jgi:hypothetical protein
MKTQTTPSVSHVTTFLPLSHTEERRIMVGKSVREDQWVIWKTEGLVPHTETTSNRKSFTRSSSRTGRQKQYTGHDVDVLGMCVYY